MASRDWQKIAERIAIIRSLSDLTPEGDERNPFAPPVGVTETGPGVMPPTFVERGLPRDARGVAIDPKILAQMDRVRMLRDAGRLTTGGQQAVADRARSNPNALRSPIWG